MSLKKIGRAFLRFFLISMSLNLVFCAPRNSTRKQVILEGDSFKKADTVESQGHQEKMRRAQDILKLIEDTEPLIDAENKKLMTNRDSVLLMNAVIQPIEAVLLKLDNILDVDFRELIGTDRRKLTYRLVNIFNQAILMVVKSNRTLLETSNILVRYKSIIFRNCDEKLNESCKLISFFGNADSFNMSQIMQLFYEDASESKEQIRILRATVDMKRNRLDSSLRMMLMMHTFSSLKLRKDGLLSGTRAQLDRQLFNSILKLDSDGFSNDDIYISMIRELKPWEMTRNSSAEISKSLPEILELSAGKFLYSSSAKSKLSSSMLEAIEQLKYRVGDDFELGVEFQKSNILGRWSDSGNSPKEIFSSQIDSQIRNAFSLHPQVTLFGSESSNILETMLGDVKFKYDEYFFLSHRIFYEQYYISDSDAFWGKSKQEGARLIAAASNIIRMQLVYNIVYTNARMSQFYEKNTSSGLISLLQQTKQEADFLTLSWEKINQRATYLRDFINRVIPDSDYKNRRARDEFRKLVRSIKMNIKYIASYPSMYPLLLMMSKKKLKASLWFGTIDHSELVNSFFAGVFSPWFSFGGDTTKLDSNEILISFYYTVITQTLNSYKNTPNVNFDTKEFFEIIVKKVVEETIKQLKLEILELNKVRKGFASKIDNLQKMCREEIALQEEERKELSQFEPLKEKEDYYQIFEETMRPRIEGSNDLDFSRLDQEIVYPPNSEMVDDSAKNYFKKLYDGRSSRVFDNFKRTYTLRHQKVRILLQIFKEFSDELVKEKPGESSLEDIVENEFAKYETLKRDYTSLYFSMQDEIEWDGKFCNLAFMRRDRDVRYVLLFKEAKFLGDLFDSVYHVLGGLSKSQRENPSQDIEEQLELVRKKFFKYAGENKSLPIDYTENLGYAEMSGIDIVMYLGDYFSRLVSYLEEKPFRENYQFSYLKNYKNLENGLLQKSRKWRIVFDLENKKQRSEMRKAFVRQGLLAFAQVFPWAKRAPFLTNAEKRKNLLVDLFKMNSMELIEGGCENEESLDGIKTQGCRRVSAKKVINYHTEYLEYLNFSELDEAVFDIFSVNKKYVHVYYESQIKEVGRDELLSYFDLLFRSVFSDSDVQSNESVWFEKGLGLFAKKVDDLQKAFFVFPFDKEKIYGFFNVEYEQWVADYFSSTRRFLMEAKRVAPHFKPKSFRYEAGDSLWIGNSSGSAMEIDPLISKFEFTRYLTFTTDLNRQFKFYYRDAIQKGVKHVKQSLATELPGDSE